MKLVSMDSLVNSLVVRGYKNEIISELLEVPILFIPTSDINTEQPIQELTPDILSLSKEMQKEGFSNEIILIQNKQHKYIEKRNAHADLGTIVLNLISLGTVANFAQIADFLLNFIQFRFGRHRTDDLMPDVKFNLNIHNGDKRIELNYEGPATEVKELREMLTQEKVNAMFD